MNEALETPQAAEAVSAFAADLRQRRLLDATTRLETTVRGRCALEPLRRVEAAFDSSWPPHARPTHELIWALHADDETPSVSMSAYDELGRLLLNRRFAASEMRDA